MQFSTLFWQCLRQLAGAGARLGLLPLVCLSMLAPACSRKGTKSSDSEGAGETSSADFVRMPPDGIQVEPGSLDVIITPDSNDESAPRLVQLFSEEGAEIYFSLISDGDLQPGTLYEKPIIMVPPFEIHAVARKDDQTGPVRQAFYGNEADEKKFSVPTRLSLASKFGVGQSRWNSQFLDAAKTRDRKDRFMVLDAKGDTPSHLKHIDIENFSASESDGNLKISIQLAATPLADSHIGYGLELGPSQITVADFGKGADYRWRVDCSLESCRLAERDSDETVGTPDIKVDPDNNVIAITVATDTFGKTFSDNFAVRAYAVDARKTTPVIDRTLPVYLHSPFDLYRGRLAGMTSETAELDLMVTEENSDPALLDDYRDTVSTVAPLIEKINAFPLFNQGSTPLFVMPGSKTTFTGINSTDRGVYAGLGSNASALAMSQLIAHEFGHFQNSGWSLLQSRWIQEGLSEWTAERALYQLYPAKAVYRFLRQLRVDPFLRILQHEDGSSPLNEWNSLETNYGYEKVYLFFVILNRVVGSDVIARAQLIGRNQALNTDQFQDLLEKLSGKNLDRLFSYWVRPGTLADEFDPSKLFVDQDSDGLLAIDETDRGTSDNNADSNHDGIDDGEEVFSNVGALMPNFSNRSPAKLLGDEVVVHNLVPKEANDLLRIGSQSGGSVAISPYPELLLTSDFLSYNQKILLRPPFQIGVRSSEHVAVAIVPALTLDGNHSPAISAPPALTEASGLLPQPQLASTNDSELASWELLNAPVSHLDDLRQDVPQKYEGLDIIDTAVRLADDRVTVTIQTAGAIDRFGKDGGFSLEFRRQIYVANDVPEFPESLTVKTDGNTVYMFNADQILKDSEVKRIRLRHVDQDKVELSIPNDLLSPMLAEDSNSVLCTTSDITADDKNVLHDNAGCIQLRWSGFELWQGRLPSPAGEGVHVVDFFVPQGTKASDRDYLRRSVVNALSAWTLNLGRPLWDRHYWPVHAMFTDNGETWNDVDRKSGVFFSSARPGANFPIEGFAESLVVQVARLIIPDASERIESTSPLWVREIFTDWLGQVAMGAFAQTKAWHAYNESYRLGHWVCYQQSGCAQTNVLRAYYSSERNQGLSQWQSFYDGTLAQQKTLMALIDLHSLIGNDGLRRAFFGFYNFQPSGDDFIRILQAQNPTRTTQLTDWSTRWGASSKTPTLNRNEVFSRFNRAPGVKLYPVERSYLIEKYGQSVADAYEAGFQ